MQQIGYGAQFVGNLPRVRDARSQPERQLRIPRGQFAFDSSQLHLQGGQRLAGAVVQVARDAPPLLVLHP